MDVLVKVWVPSDCLSRKHIMSEVKARMKVSFKRTEDSDNEHNIKLMKLHFSTITVISQDICSV